MAQQFIAGISQGAEPDTITSLFSVDAVIKIPGDVGVLPWIGQKTGRQAIADFIRATRTMTEILTFDIDDIVASDARAVVVGELASRIIATGKVVETAIAIILTISNELIVRFQMLEDSFAVSRAARR